MIAGVKHSVSSYSSSGKENSREKTLDGDGLKFKLIDEAVAGIKAAGVIAHRADRLPGSGAQLFYQPPTHFYIFSGKTLHLIAVDFVVHGIGGGLQIGEVFLEAVKQSLECHGMCTLKLNKTCRVNLIRKNHSCPFLLLQIVYCSI